ncbi:MAG TPA: hypothetical protein VIM89_04165 [Mucilaginibacter sp.]
MRIKYLLFLPLFFLVSLAFTKNSETSSHENNRHYLSKGKSDLTKNSNTSYSIIISPVESTPVINLRVHKTVHYAQHMFFVENDYLARLKHYNFFSGSGHKQSFASQTALLFPFHAFW